jgi:glyoxylase-like metal-dependent hydrolase (beta-lactamase superfamily II)
MLTQVTDGVLVHQSELLRNNAVVVRGDAGVLVVDPGLTEDEMVDLANGIRESGRPVVAGFATHPDWDHVLWHPELGDAPRYGTARCASDMREFLSDPDWKARAAEELPPEIADQTPLDLFGRIEALPAGAARIPWEGPTVRVIEHRGHSAGHAALLVAGRGVLVAGDMLSDVFIPMLDLSAADPIGDYLAALDLFEGVAADVDFVIPGHGSVGDAAEFRARVDQDRAYLHALRDRQEPSDSRIGPSAEEGWEWVTEIHDWQAQQLAER